MRKFMNLYLRGQIAWRLFKERRRTMIPRQEAALKIGISPDFLLLIELGLKAPPLCVIYDLLTVYGSRDETIMFFCMLRFPCSLKLRAAISGTRVRHQKPVIEAP